jgi:hypothetical protein
MFFYVLWISFLYIISFYFLGLLLVNSQVIPTVGSNHVRTIAVRYTVGVLLNFLLLMSSRDMTLARTIYLLLVCSGVVLFFFNFKTETMVIRRFITDWKHIAIAAFLCLYLCTIISTPLDGWDARNIWFFHAKILYFDHGLSHTVRWHEIDWSHPDYPLLIPFMGAQISYFCGIWNDYLSRLSLFIVLVMCVLWLKRIFSDFTEFLLSLLLVLAIGEFAWNGYMDGYLALLFSLIVAMLFVIIKERALEDMVGMIVCLGLLTNIKNEGILLCASFMGSLLVYFLMFERKSVSCNQRVLIRTGLFTLLAFAPMMLWSMYKKLWKIENDLGLFGRDFFTRLADRTNDLFIVSGKIIKATILTNLSMYFVLSIFIVLLCFGASFLKRNAKWFLISMLSFIFYYLGIFAIYFTTPMNLNWHLATSADRVMMSLWLPIVSMLLLFINDRSRSGLQNRLAIEPCSNEP